MGILRYVLAGNFGLEFWTALVSTMVVVLICLPIHEFAHGWAANKLGDPTARNLGRLDLNPIAHLDLVGTAAIFLFGFGWAKPVPVDSRCFKNRKWGMALTALAGPLSNIVLAFVFMLLYKIIRLWIDPMAFSSRTPGDMILILQLVMEYIIFLNLSLAVFNLIPIPPLDGSKILSAVLPDRIYYFVMRYERYSILLVYLVMFSGILDRPFNMVMSVLYGLLDFLTGFLN